MVAENTHGGRQRWLVRRICYVGNRISQLVQSCGRLVLHMTQPDTMEYLLVLATVMLFTVTMIVMVGRSLVRVSGS